MCGNIFYDKDTEAFRDFLDESGLEEDEVNIVRRFAAQQESLLTVKQKVGQTTKIENPLH